MKPKDVRPGARLALATQRTPSDVEVRRGVDLIQALRKQRMGYRPRRRWMVSVWWC